MVYQVLKDVLYIEHLHYAVWKARVVWFSLLDRACRAAHLVNISFSKSSYLLVLQVSNAFKPSHFVSLAPLLRLMTRLPGRCVAALVVPFGFLCALYRCLSISYLFNQIISKWTVQCVKRNNSLQCWWPNLLMLKCSFNFILWTVCCWLEGCVAVINERFTYFLKISNGKSLCKFLNYLHYADLADDKLSTQTQTQDYLHSSCNCTEFIEAS
jgi:hypothetical protein